MSSGCSGGAKLGDLSGASRMVAEALKANDGKDLT